MNGNKGSFTVEAALVLPIVFLTFFAIIIVSIVHYQNVVTSAAVMQSATEIASAWEYLGDGASVLTNNSTPSGQLSDNDPYRFIFDSKNAARSSNARDYVYGLATGIPINDYSDTLDIGAISVNKTGNILFSYIEVSVKKSYTNPFGNLLSSLGVGAQFDSTRTASAILTNPTEFIRNIDFLVEVVEKYK